MKQQVMQTVHVCDKCASPQVWGIDACLNCGAEHCYDCKKTEGREYAHAVHVSGSGDGYYCNDCDAKLTKEGTDKRHKMYRYVKSLRDEGKAWSEDYRRRCDLAEKQLAELRPNNC